MQQSYQKNSFKIYLFFLIYFFYGCAAAGAILVPLDSIEPPKGKYGIGTQVYFWTDKNRSEVYTTDPEDFRELMVQVWYPAKKGEGYQSAPHITFPKKAITTITRTTGIPTNFGLHGTQLTSNSVYGLPPMSDSQFPLILFSHGDGGLLNQNTSQVEELVSNGYVVIACNHTYNASISFDKNGEAILYKQNITWGEQAQHHKKYYTNMLINYRYQDLAFLLDELKKDKLQDGKDNPFKQIIDFTNVGAMGHSMGGGTAYMGMLKDKNIKAGVAFDGWFFGLLEKEASSNTNKPFLHIGQEQFLDYNIPGDINGSPDGKKNFAIYQTMLKNNAESFGVYVKNSLHYSFTDLKLIYKKNSPLSLPLDSLGEIDKKIIDIVMDNLVLDFFNYSLKNKQFDIKGYSTYDGNVIYKKHQNISN